MNKDDIKELIEAIAETDVTELLVQNKDGSKVRIRRGGPQQPVVTQTFAPAPLPQAVPQPVAAAASPATLSVVESPAAEAEDNGDYVTSPFVGTFYRAASPESPNYVELGQKVKKGQVLCIIEAMKIMNEIEAEVGGTVVEILAENGQPVEFEQRLFRIEAA